MGFRSLRAFIDALDEAGELQRITQPIHQDLEITAATLAHMAHREGGKALLFENVEGQSIPVLTNALGSRKRMAMAFGVDKVEDLAEQIKAYTSLVPKFSGLSTWEKIKMVPELARLRKFPPKTVRSGPVQDVVWTGSEIDLNKLPILKCWPKDGGRYVTFPMVITRDPDAGSRNIGMYRLQQYDHNTTGMHWHIHKDSAGHFHRYKELGERMPVCVAIGGDPSMTFSAICPLPPGIDEYLFAGFIRGESVKMVKAVTNELLVPAEADIILEGYVDPTEMRLEGPFGDHTGYYSLEGDYPVFHLTAITMRKDPVWFATVVGKPPKEDFYMGEGIEKLFLPLMKLPLGNDIVDMTMPWEGVFHSFGVFSIRKRFPMQARRIMTSLWGIGQMAFTKMLLVLDDGEDIRSNHALARLMLNTSDFRRDLFFSEGILDVLDHASPQPMYGSKLGLDLTEEQPGEPVRELPDYQPFELEDSDVLAKLQALDPAVESARVPYRETLHKAVVISLTKSSREQLQSLAHTIHQDEGLAPLDVILFIDAPDPASDVPSAMWRFFNNVDPSRDVTVDATGWVWVDATKKRPDDGHKRPWPDDNELPADVVERVQARLGHELGDVEPAQR